MVYIITGAMNSGKTTSMIQHFRELVGQAEGHMNYNVLDFNVDGFVAIKEMDGDIVKSYKCHQLATGNEMTMAIRETYLKGNESIKYQLGPYCFLNDTFRWIDTCLKDLIGFKAKAIFLDEVGQLEINGNGYDKSIRKILNAKLDLYITVREDLIEDVVNHFNIRKYKIL